MGRGLWVVYCSDNYLRNVAAVFFDFWLWKAPAAVSHADVETDDRLPEFAFFPVVYRSLGQ